MGRKNLQAVRRSQILDACEELVLAEGLASASPARVAGRVGLDRTTLHHYFRTRSDLLGGLVERIVDGYLADVRAVQAERGSTADVAEILDIPAGTAIRFEPGQERIVTLVAYAGAREVYGFNAAVNGPLE